nr:hypothetical protein BaRGS_034957 [Batillaria attramentaria]
MLPVIWNVIGSVKRLFALVGVSRTPKVDDFVKAVFTTGRRQTETLYYAKLLARNHRRRIGQGALEKQEICNVPFFSSINWKLVRVQALPPPFTDTYRPRREYVYRYEAQLSTGAPQSSKLWSGLRLTANLHLQFDKRSKVNCMFKDVILYKMDKFVEERTPSFFVMPEEQLNEGIEEDTVRMTRQLQVPFSIVWDNGNVREVRLLLGEPLWSANIKRGAISVLEINLNQYNPVNPIINTGANIDPYQPSWTVYEPTPLGYCLTIYTPKPSPVNAFYVSKVRDYSLCFQKQPVFDVINNFRHQEFDHKSTKPLSMTGEFTYTIKGNKKKFLMLTAVGESKIVFKPYDKDDVIIQTSIK